MKIIELDKARTNSSIKLILIGILLVPFLNSLTNLLSGLIFLLPEPEVISIKVSLYLSYVINGLVVLGLIYLIVIAFLRDKYRSDRTLIILKQKHFKQFIVLFLLIYSLNFLVTYLTRHSKELAISNCYDSFEVPQMIIDNLTVIGGVFSFLKGFLIVLLIPTLLLKESKE